jgi:carboxypeptidase family protein
MKKTLAVVFAFVAATFSMPLATGAAGAAPLAVQGGGGSQGGGGNQGGTVNGQATDSAKQPISQAQVRLRNINAPEGTQPLTSTADAAGNFSFANVPPGNYVVEIVDAAGNVIGVSSPVVAVAGTTATVAVTASAVSALAVASGAAGAVAWVSSAAGILTLAAAGGLAIVGSAAATDENSPSR